jgi:hypothetical protein
VSGPAPPADLDSRHPSLLTIDPGETLHRFWTRVDGPRLNESIYYDSTRSGRLNAPDASYGVLYTANDPHGAFAETFLRTPGRRTIDPGHLARKAYVRLTVMRPLRLIDFDGPNLAILGATAAVVHGDQPYDNSQAWSAALRAHPLRADGISYTARHDPHQICYALFSRPFPTVREERREEDLDAPWFWEIADRYQVGMAPR